MDVAKNILGAVELVASSTALEGVGIEDDEEICRFIIGNDVGVGVVGMQDRLVKVPGDFLTGIGVVCHGEILSGAEAVVVENVEGNAL